MKKSVRVIACLLLVAILCTSCGLAKSMTVSTYCDGISIEKTAYTPQSVKKVADETGMSLYANRDYIFVFQNASNDNYRIYNAKTGATVNQYDSSKMKNVDFFIVNKHVYIMVTVSKSTEGTETMVYTDNGNLVVKKDGSFDYDDVKINSGLNLFIFEGAVYRAESDGSAKVVLDNPFATDIPSVDVETDNYYYDITDSAVVVYDKSLNLVLYKDIPYSYSIDANVLSGDYILIQWMEMLPDTEKKYDYIYEGEKVNLKSLIVEAATGKEKEVDLDYIVANVIYCSDYKTNSKVSYNFKGVENILEVLVCGNEKFIYPDAPTSMVSVNSKSGKIEQTLLGEDSEYTSITPLENGYYLANAKDGGYYILDSDGNAKKITKTIYNESSKNDAYILNDGKLYDYRLQLVFDYEAAEYSLASGISGSPVMKNAVIFTDENSKYHLYTAGGTDKVIDGTVVYAGSAFYVVKNSGEYAVYTTDGNRVGESIKGDSFSIVSSYDTGAVFYVFNGSNRYYYNISK